MYNAISLFSNAGIGDLGVENAGVRVLFANELLEKRANTYSLNHPHTHIEVGDINLLSQNNFSLFKDSIKNKELFLLVATPPCQGVSNAGRRNKFDIRNQLIKPTVKSIIELKPRWVWIENVSGYMNASIPDTLDIVEDSDEVSRINIIDFINKHLSPLGYEMAFDVLDAKDYGVPQSRKRLIIILTRSGITPTLPNKSHGIDGVPYTTVRDAIGHLESLKSGEKTSDIYHFGPKHPEHHLKWMSKTPEGQTAFDNKDSEYIPQTIDKKTGLKRKIKAFRTTYKRIWWDKPSPTVTMSSGAISSQNNVHPCDVRALSIRELMLLQTLPNSYKFPKNTTEKEMREMLGEAVPSLLAQKITEHIIELDKTKKDA